MSLPGFLTGAHGTRDGIVDEFWIFAQTSPETESFPCIVALVDEVALGRVSAMCFLQGLHGALPGLSLEAAIFAQAQLHTVAETSEEGGLVCRRPTEPGSAAVAIDPGRSLPVRPQRVDFVVGHDEWRLTRDGVHRQTRKAMFNCNGR